MNGRFVLKPGPDGLIPNKNLLTGVSGPIPEVQRKSLYVLNVLEAVIPGSVLNRQSKGGILGFILRYPLHP